MDIPTRSGISETRQLPLQMSLLHGCVKSFLTLARTEAPSMITETTRSPTTRTVGLGWLWWAPIGGFFQPSQSTNKKRTWKMDPKKRRSQSSWKNPDFVNKPREVPSVLCNSSVDEMYPTMPLADRNSVDVMPGSCTFPDQHLDLALKLIARWGKPRIQAGFWMIDIWYMIVWFYWHWHIATSR